MLDVEPVISVDLVHEFAFWITDLADLVVLCDEVPENGPISKETTMRSESFLPQFFEV